MEFLDAWGEGDAERAYCCWRIFLPHCVASHHTKYALQALRLQFQVKGYLSQHLAYEIDLLIVREVWARTFHVTCIMNT